MFWDMEVLNVRISLSNNEIYAQKMWHFFFKKEGGNGLNIWGKGCGGLIW